MHVPAVAAGAVPSSGPAQPPRGQGARREHGGDGSAGAVARPGSVLPSEKGTGQGRAGQGRAALGAVSPVTHGHLALLKSRGG
ncbi:hypothetical protein Nmel_010401 [Mimus melanotis]